MASTQYIGARYVPFFYTDPDTGANTWRAGIAYDPLTIVTDLNQSYTSKIPVPATVGRPSENPAYWVMTGAYNAQVESYHQDVESYHQDVEQFKTDVNDTFDDIREYTREAFPAFVMIGDSYGHASGANYGWIDKMISKLGLVSGSTVFEQGAGGAAFNSNALKTFYTMITEVAASMSAEQKNSVGTVIIAGGANERGLPADSIIEFRDSCLYHAHELFPNAIIYVCMNAACIDNNYTNAQAPRILRGYSYNLPTYARFMNNVQYAMHGRNYLNTDNVHLSEIGYDILANAMIQALKNTYTYHYTSTTNVLTKIGNVSDATYHIDINNDIANFGADMPVRADFAATNYGFNQSVQIATIPEKSFLGATSVFYNFNRTKNLVIARAAISGGNLFNVLSTVWIDNNGGVWLTNVDPKLSGETSALANIIGLWIPPFSITAPSIAV